MPSHKRSRKTLHTTLIYPGPYDDNSFLEKDWSRQYTRFILIDAMPATKYFPEYTETEDMYFSRLQCVFGSILSHDMLNKILFFPNGVEYRYNHDAEAIDKLEPNSDIFFSGYYPNSWKPKGFLKNRKIFRGCTTVPLGLIKDTGVHVSDCDCFQSEDE